MKTYQTKNPILYKKMMRKYGSVCNIVFEANTENDLSIASSHFAKYPKNLPEGTVKYAFTAYDESNDSIRFLLPDGNSAIIYGFRIENNRCYYKMMLSDGSIQYLPCDSYLVVITELGDFKLTDNMNIRKGIYKGIQRCDGNCPCNHPEDDGDLHCPCEGYRLRNRCCCRLYVQKDE